MIWNGMNYSLSSKLQENLGDFLIENMDIKENDRILDLGCGVGNITFKIAKILKTGKITGIDYSSSMIEQCKEAIDRNEINNIEFYNLSALELNYEEEFDIIFSNSVIHWIKEDESLLKVIYRALKKNGRIVLQFPLLNSKHPLVHISESVIDKLGIQKFYEGWTFPWYVPDEKAYECLLINQGFNEVNVSRFTSTFKFDTFQKAYGFFDSVGYKLYLEPLPAKEKDLFVTEFQKELERLGLENGYEFYFDRIAVTAKVSK